MNKLTYILKDGIPVLESDIRKWGEWFGNSDNCRIAFTEINDVKISTVFLGIDKAFGVGEPILFETIIFGGEHNRYQKLYYTLEEAMFGHERAVSLVGGEQ